MPKSLRVEIESALLALRWFYRGQRALLKQLEKQYGPAFVAPFQHQMRDDEGSAKRLICKKFERSVK